MVRVLWNLLLLAAAVVTASAQHPCCQSFTYITPDLAATQLIKRVVPDYPPMAQAAHIQGNVILRIEIDTQGNVSRVQVFRGHPMLTSAAVAAVKKWKYRPFENDGHPFFARTIVAVRFGNPVNHDAEDAEEVAFQARFWEVVERAHRMNTNLPVFEHLLTEAETALRNAGSPELHQLERWQVAMMKGDLLKGKKDIENAEHNYVEALDIIKSAKDSPERAESLAALGILYFDENKLDLAGKNLTEALDIYAKNFKTAANDSPGKWSYAHWTANGSWTLSRIAAREGRQSDALRHCRTALDMKPILQSNENAISECENLVGSVSR